MRRVVVLLVVPVALVWLLAACSASPQDMTIHGTVTLRSLNGVPPADAYSGYGGTSDITTQVNIVADDGPGNYSGRPWNEADTDMILKSATAKQITYTFTAQVPADAQLYQVTAVCCTQADAQADAQDFTLQEMRQGVALCFGDGCTG